MSLSIVQTALLFVVIPLSVAVLVFGIVFLAADVKHGVRYRPGKPWNFAPVWYQPHVAFAAKHRAAALPAGEGETFTNESVGGANGEW